MAGVHLFRRTAAVLPAKALPGLCIESNLQFYGEAYNVCRWGSPKILQEILPA